MTELTGQVLGERYRVEAFLGQGGMADVYKVRDLRRAVFLAMKVLHADLAEDQVFIRNFEREAQTLERLQHPNIVRFYGFEKTRDIAFILMDFIDGLTLRREIFLFKNGMRPGRILEVMQPVCAALFYAHQLGMIHCDIKPANIITHRNGTVYLTDFGIARRSESGTQPLTGVGSPAYMAPEQFDGKDPTQATDIYSLGVVLYEMLTGGQRPFTGESGRTSGSTTKRVVWEKKNLQPPSPRTYNPEITPEMEAVVMICLQRSPRRRYRSTLDLLQALEMAVRGPQPEDDAQTRVDLAKPGKAAQPPRQQATGATSGPAQPPGKPALADGKLSPAAGKSPSMAATSHPAQVKPPQATGKDQPAGGRPTATAAEKLPAVVNLPAAEKTPPAGKAASEKSPLPVEKGHIEASKPAGPGGKTPERPAGKPSPAGQSPGVAGRPAQNAEKPKADAHAVPVQPANGANGQSRGPAAGKLPGVVKKPAMVKKAAVKPAAGKTTMRRRIRNWLVVSAGGLALALVFLANFSGRVKAPTPPQSPPSSVAAVAATITHAIPFAQAPIEPAAPIETGALTQAAATPTAQAAAAETLSPLPTPTGGGRKVAFASDRGGVVQVWIMDAANPENRQQVTNAGGGACQPAWSPDGNQIAFTTPCKGPSVYYPGSTIKIIRLANAEITDLPVKTPGVAGAFDPAWSPNGETLLYTAILGEKTEIRALNLKDLHMRTLANRGTKNTQPAWSRDGKYISYIYSDDQNWDALWYMDLNGESKEWLARSERFSESVWAPDGVHILASINKGDNIPVLMLFNRAHPTDGGSRLLSGDFRMSHASISPDGEWVVFWTEKAGKKSEIMLASMDGKQVQTLTNNNIRDFHPAWSPK